MEERYEVQENGILDQPPYEVIDMDGAGERICFCDEMERAERIAELLNKHGIEPDTE